MNAAFPTATRFRRTVALVASAVLFLAFCGLGQTKAGLAVRYIPPFTMSSTGEVYFWLAHALLLVPSGLLLGYSVAPRVATLLAHFDQALAKLTPREVTISLASLFLFGVGLARTLQSLVLLDSWIADDESAVQFGGRVLASGHFAVLPPPLFEFMPNKFLFVTPGGEVGSMDWIGVQLAWAVGELVHQPRIVFALLAVLPVPAIAYVVGQRIARPWGAFAAFFFVLSPMAFALTTTAHAHLLSRGLLALALAIGVSTELHDRGPRYAWLGLVLGMAFLCRPFETGCLALPFVVSHLWRAGGGDTSARKSLPFLILGLALPALLFLFWNHRMTGQWLVPPRFSSGVISTEKGMGMGLPTLAILWHRFGANIGYNLFMLSIWFLGPVGIAFVILGITTNRLTKLLGVGMVLNLFLGLAHDNYGVHIVGPIHYSECVVPLTVIAAFGFHRTCVWLAQLRVDPMRWSATILVGLTLSLGTFNYWNALALHGQAEIHDALRTVVTQENLPRAVLFVPNYAKLWNTFPEYGRQGAFVYEWPKNQPDASDHVILMRYAPDRIEPASRAYPDRAMLRLVRVPNPGPGESGMEIQPLYVRPRPAAAGK